MSITKLTPPTVRFWAKVKKTKTCWLWTAASSRGYGQLGINKKLIYAHRFSYELHRGKIPQGLHIDHLCRVKKCVNPRHLEVVTQRQNTIRGIIARKKTLPVGVSKRGKRYRARCYIDNVFHYIGTYDTPQEAYNAFIEFTDYP